MLFKEECSIPLLTATDFQINSLQNPACSPQDVIIHARQTARSKSRHFVGFVLCFQLSSLFVSIAIAATTATLATDGWPEFRILLPDVSRFLDPHPQRSPTNTYIYSDGGEHISTISPVAQPEGMHASRYNSRRQSSIVLNI